MFGADTQNPEDDVIHGGAKDGAVALDVQAPPSIVGMLSGEEIIHHLDPIRVRNRRSRDVPGDDQAREKKEGASILAGPIPAGQLKTFEEGQGVSSRVQSSRRPG